MTRSSVMLLLSGLAAMVACDQSVGPATTGSITLRLVVPSVIAGAAGAPTALSRAVDLGAGEVLMGPETGARGTEEADLGIPQNAVRSPAATTLESIRVSVSGGPTAKTQNFTCTATLCEGTVDGLAPGAYTVTVEGLVTNQVVYYGTTTGVSVTAGTSTAATITFQSFQPILADFPADTVEVLRFPVSFSAVPAAEGYTVQWATAADFSNASSVSLTTTSTEITVTQEARYHVRVKALNSVVSTNGSWSAPKSLYAFQGVANVTVSPATATISPGGTQQFGATATDADNNTVPNVTFYWASSDPTIATVDQTGLATAKIGAGGSVTITALGKGQPGNATLTVGAQVADHLAFTIQPTNTTAGDAISPAIQVEIRDAGGNRVTSARDAVTMAFAANPGSGTLAGTKTVNAIDGVASFTGLWINKAGTGYTLAASAGGLTGQTSAGFNISPGAPSKLGFSAQPSDVEGNVVVAPAVQVTIRDLYDNVVNTATNAVTLSLVENPWRSAFSVGGTVSGTLTTAAVTGVATFNNLRVDKPAPAYALGANSGALTPATSSPFNVSLTVQQMAAGGGHTCAVSAGGSYCWGYNGDGRLGVVWPTTVRDSVPALVRGNLTFVKVTTGGAHSCGITSGGDAYCWGYNGYGQLGNNSTAPSDVPVLVQGGFQFADIDAGEIHTCAVTTQNAGDYTRDRRVLCWGYNYYGQLGNGAAVPGGADALVPVRVDTTLLKTAASITAGGYHTCARAAGTSGVAYCWGQDYNGQVGDGVVFGAVAGRNVPTLVLGAITNWTSLSSGAYHTCGTRVSGETLCWGYAYYGQVGNQANGNSSGYSSDSLPRVVYGTSGGAPLSFSSVSAGYYHTCALTSGGAGYCWGNNGSGQLGDNNEGTNSNQPVTVAGGLTFVTTSITSGSSHTCARTSTSAYCWGSNGDGRLGIGTTTGTQAQPIQIKQ